ncbi:MAG: prenyltransferase [Paludibacteraceae bacterium]|nr:prenyltransferase [Paludibacteraceae bacterium]
MNTLKRYFIATRPWSFPVSIAPVFLTGEYINIIYPGAQAGSCLWAVLGIIIFHAASNLFSDYYDYKKGVDTDPSIGSPTITGKLLTARQTIIYAWILLVIATINGLVMAYFTGWPLLVIGGIGALLIILYPWFKYHALGDLDIFLTFGILPTLGTAFVMTGQILWSSLWITLSFATITVAVLHANNTRDCGRDGNAHIHTFAMLIGPKASQLVYYIEVWLPICWVLLCVCLGKMPWPLLIGSACASLIAFRNTKVMKAWGHGGSIDKLDQMTAQHQLTNLIFLLIAFFAMRIL